MSVRLVRWVLGILVLWSGLGHGVAFADTTPPSAPAQPTEGSRTSDKDYDTNGAYTVYWSAASDAESGISAYELQERVGPAGSWTTLTATTTSTSRSVSGRLHNTWYFYQVRAKNGAGLWGVWSPASDGMLVDTTRPTPVIVTDDGATTASTTTLHATWTPANDPESGVALYQYIIRRDAVAGTTVVSYTSMGLATEVTRANLSLTDGVTYFIGVRAKNNAGLYSSVNYSDGIQVATADVTPPTGTININAGVAVTNVTAVTLTLSATDEQSSVTSMRFANDNTTYSSAEPYGTTKTWTLASGDGEQTVYAQFQDDAGNWNAASPATDTITLDTIPPTLTAPAVSDTTTTTALITWTTEEPASSQVEYGTTTSYGATTLMDPTLVTSHSITVIGLAPHTSYHVRARSAEAAGNTAVSDDLTFTTANTAPVLTAIEAQTIAEGETLTLTVTATDADGDALTYGAEPLPEGSTMDAATGRFQWTPASGQQGSYVVTLSVSDSALTDEETLTITVTDGTAPRITDLSATATETAATIAWTTDEATDAQVEYGLTVTYGSVTPVEATLVTGHTMTLTGLSAATTYHYRVASRDALGNLATSPDQTFSTVADGNPPTGTIILNGGAEYATEVTVTLTLAATDAEGAVIAMRCSNDNMTYADPIAYATSARWDLSSGDGTKTVYAQFQDQTGNWSAPVSDTIILDTVPPMIQITDPQDQEVITGP